MGRATGRPVAPKPAAVEAEAWTLAAQLPDHQRMAARVALRALAGHGWSTELNAQLTGKQIDTLTTREFFGLRRLWEAALACGLRSHPVPTRSAEFNARRSRPPTVDERAWELALSLPGADATLALWALRELDERGQPTSLDTALPPVVFLRLGERTRRGLRKLSAAACSRGLRPALVPDKQSEWAYRNDLEGVNEDTVAFVRSLGARRLEPFALLWLRRLRAAGLPTDLDVDLEAPAVRELLDAMLEEAAGGKLAQTRTHDQLNRLRAALRFMYAEACAQKKRTRPVPIEIAHKFGYSKGALKALMKRLPVHDRQALTTLKVALRELNRLQQAGRGQAKGSDRARAKKKTEAQTTSSLRIRTLNSFLHHAGQWESEDLAAGVKSSWSLEDGLAAVMTPAHIARWAYQGHKPDGSRKARATCTAHHKQILRLLERAAEAGAAIVTPERILEIQAELERVRDNEEWNVPSLLEADPDDDETGKWFPTLDQLKAGIASLRADWQRAKLAYENGDTFLRYWRAARDYVMAYGALICMWRVDTVATIDLSRVVRDPNTRRVRWSDGTIRIRNGARAKQARGHNYLVEMLIIPGEVVDLIEMLFKIEGRSLESRLRPGEDPVRLAIGDRYGNDELMEVPRTVIPLFRARFDLPAALNGGSVMKCLRARLFAMGWDATNPHTLRAAGAIHWRFVLGRTYEAIMRLGLWSDEAVLKRCYARLNSADIDTEIANGAPSHELVSAVGSNELAKALEEAQSKALALRIKPEAPSHELIATARILRVAASRLEKAAGASDGTERPSPLKSDEDLVRIDQALRPVVRGGVNELLGYEALGATKDQRKKPARTQRRMLSRLRAETRAAPTHRAARRTA